MLVLTKVFMVADHGTGSWSDGAILHSRRNAGGRRRGWWRWVEGKRLASREPKHGGQRNLNGTLHVLLYLSLNVAA